MAPELPEVPIERSEAAYQKACRVLAGGVSTPLRAFKAVGGVPRFIAKGKGPILTDLDGNNYIDYVCSWGPLILGHADVRVSAALTKALTKGWGFGAPTELETMLAERICRAMPSIERLRFVSSFTEAVMSAVRLARGHTGRDLIVKCQGCYHGHGDAMLVKPAPDDAGGCVASSAGVPAAVTANTLLLPYNDLSAAQALFQQKGRQIAAFLVEPVATNMGLVPPAPGYLAGVRALCSEHETLLIFDESSTGFRVAYGGAQELYKVRPDLTCLGRIIGGGLPIGAYGGKVDILAKLAPDGPVFQAGTLAGNPMAMAAGIATLDALIEQGTYDQLDAISARLADGLTDAAAEAGLAVRQARVGSILSLALGNHNTEQSATLYARFFHAMLERGVYLPPSATASMFVSLAHSPRHIDRTATAAREAFSLLAESKE